jgi:hypothetical protein
MTKKAEDGVEAVSQENIKTVAHEFNREDLNEMRDTVNQLVEAVNNLLTK